MREKIYIEQAIRLDPVLCEMGTVVEYTAPYTPQQNGKVEQAFPTLFSRAPFETRFRRTLFCIHEVETWDLRIMLFSKRMHLM